MNAYQRIAGVMQRLSASRALRPALFALASAMILFSQPSIAGFIEIKVTEFKGHIVIPGIPQTTVRFVESGMEVATPPYYLPKILINKETIEIPGSAVDQEYDLYNIYTKFLEFPDPPVFLNPYFIHFFWFMAANTGLGIGPLPVGTLLTAGSLFGGRTGTEFTATITAINDLADLPIQSPGGLEIGWDLSGLSQTTGNFFLAHAILPSDEVFQTAEPGSLVLFAIAGAWLLGFIRRRGVRPIYCNRSARSGHGLVARSATANN